MTVNPEFSFSDQCREKLGPFLIQYGFSYAATHYRPRGISVEFARGKSCLFAVCEGDVLYVDLILHVTDEQYFRVSLNQVLWFNNVRSLLGMKSCDLQLCEFVRTATTEECCQKLLGDDRPRMDERYCFPMTGSSRREYLMAQRGE